MSNTPSSNTPDLGAELSEWTMAEASTELMGSGTAFPGAQAGLADVGCQQCLSSGQGWRWCQEVTVNQSCHSPQGGQSLGKSCPRDVPVSSFPAALGSLPCGKGSGAALCHPMSPRLFWYQLRLLLPSAALHTGIQNSCTQITPVLLISATETGAKSHPGIY